MRWPTPASVEACRSGRRPVISVPCSTQRVIWCPPACRPTPACASMTFVSAWSSSTPCSSTMPASRWYVSCTCDGGAGSRPGGDMRRIGGQAAGRVVRQPRDVSAAVAVALLPTSEPERYNPTLPLARQQPASLHSTLPCPPSPRSFPAQCLRSRRCALLRSTRSCRPAAGAPSCSGGAGTGACHHQSRTRNPPSRFNSSPPAAYNSGSSSAAAAAPPVRGPPRLRSRSSAAAARDASSPAAAVGCGCSSSADLASESKSDCAAESCSKEKVPRQARRVRGRGTHLLKIHAEFLELSPPGARVAVARLACATRRGCKLLNRARCRPRVLATLG